MQTRLFGEGLSYDHEPAFPSTRFQGSKLKIVDWIWEYVKDMEFDTALDAFGGTGSVAYLLKQKGKTVTYNDDLKFNWHIGKALIENSGVRLSKDDIDLILSEHQDMKYPLFIQDTFKGIYYTDDENRWLDIVTSNINLIGDEYKKALAYFALFQACIIKRPFNLFHRNNLYVRTSDVKRSFGNKVTWDTPFEEHYLKFVEEANRAVFSNCRRNKAINCDVFDIEGSFDLVYIDTPYVSSKGVGVDYFGFYHFLEGLVNYDKWGEMIDNSSRHKRLKRKESVWTDKNRINAAFEKLFEKFQDSIIVVSYRSDGIPSINELKSMMKKHKGDVIELERKSYKYVLSNNNSEEVLLIGK
ncbi:DNA methyltransferase [Methanocella sp. CWC-04]|uniref:site-specific DNA-methyltransferase (adenine-specific) n=1 Tax=Methanooceanicella nereidis TaxID=2052831 RepID=A0AAP2RFC9_9EURY|nr:DNA methyltransferase [Methanocella sp. CWC-04]